MELYDEVRNALKRRGCPWIEEHIFEFRGQPASDKTEPYIRKDFSLEKTVAKSALRRGSLKKSCEALADGFLFWLDGMCFTPAPVKEPVPVRSVSGIRRPRRQR